MKSPREALESEFRETQAIPDPEIIGHAVSRLIDKGAQKLADPADMCDKGDQQFTVNEAWLKDVQWRAEESAGAAT